MKWKWIIPIALLLFFVVSAQYRLRNRVPLEDSSAARGAACQAFCYAIEAKAEVQPQPAPTPSPGTPSKVSMRELVSHVTEPVAYYDKHVPNVTHAVFSREPEKSNGVGHNTDVAFKPPPEPWMAPNSTCPNGQCGPSPKPTPKQAPTLAPAGPPSIPPLISSWHSPSVKAPAKQGHWERIGFRRWRWVWVE